MDRRQKKTREAIFKAFIELLSKKHYEKITVGEIIESANVGRATFYAHFETKDFLLKELCEELFCHVFDTAVGGREGHEHIFSCDAIGSVILHLFKHFEKNDNHILELLADDSNELFLRYFKENLSRLIQREAELFEVRKPKEIPSNFWLNHLSSTFVETVKWWVKNGRKESAEELSEYFTAVI